MATLLLHKFSFYLVKSGRQSSKLSNGHARDDLDKATSYRPLRRLETPNGKGIWKTMLVNYTKLNHASKNGKMLKTAVDNTRLSRVGYVLDTQG